MKLSVRDFNLEATLDSAQVFGFEKREGGVYEGVLNHSRVSLRQEGDCLHVDARLPVRWVEHYFDLTRDMGPLYDVLAEEERLAKSFQKFRGLRIIRQDSWEALAGFIISANNNFKRIQGIWKNLSRSLGKGEYYFPDAGQIARSSEKQLRDLGLGYRAPYLYRTSRMAANNPPMFDKIRSADYAEAKEQVMAFPGVGEKVADCVLLYGFGKHEAFPVDVWIWRIVRKLYFRNRRLTEKKVAEFGRRRWGTSAGYVQQYLFHGVRMGIL